MGFRIKTDLCRIRYLFYADNDVHMFLLQFYSQFMPKFSSIIIPHFILLSKLKNSVSQAKAPFF